MVARNLKKREYNKNMTSTTLDKILNGKPKQDLLGVLTSPEELGTTFGEFLEKLKARNAGVYMEAFMTLTPAELIAAASGSSTRASTPKVEVPAIENFKDEAVRKTWKARVLELLEGAGTPHGGMFESRGLSPAKIRETLGSGNEQQARDLLKELEEAKLIVSTGDTKGKKFVVTRLLDAATKVHTEEEAAKKKKEAEKAAAKAAEEAKAGPAVVTEAPKAKPAAAKK